jgi:quercetin dioxygenase-like cupin family protein
MSTPVVRAGASRRSETPNGVMTTAASPTLGGTRELSLWWVEMAEGASTPEHVFDSELLWSLVEGSARMRLDDDSYDLSPGDTAVLPAGVVRHIAATTALRAVVCGSGRATVSVPGEDGSRGTPPWVA